MLTPCARSPTSRCAVRLPKAQGARDRGGQRRFAGRRSTCPVEDGVHDRAPRQRSASTRSWCFHDGELRVRIAVLRGPRGLRDRGGRRSRRSAPDEVLVRVVVSGVCASELEPWVGRAARRRAALPRPRGQRRRHRGRRRGHRASRSATGSASGSPSAASRSTSRCARRTASRPATARSSEALAEPLACAVNAVEARRRRGSATTWSSSARASWATWCSSSPRCAAPRQLIVADTRPDALERGAAARRDPRRRRRRRSRCPTWSGR